MEKTGSYGRRIVMNKTGIYGKDRQLWKRQAVMEKTASYGKDRQLWKRQAVMEKTNSYGKDKQSWKRQAVTEKTDSYEKNGQLGTGHYLYPGLGLKRKCFELKKYIYPAINNRKFSNTLPFTSLKTNYPTFAN